MSFRGPLPLIVLAALFCACSGDKECVGSFKEVGGPDAPCRTTRSSTVTDQACFEKPQICPDLSPIRFCSRLGGSSTPINVLLDNRGETPMKVTSVKVLGDTRCAFSAPMVRPELSDSVEPGTSMVMRFHYNPPAAAGEDHAAIEITSDAENLPKLVIQVCGRSVTSTRAAGMDDCLACQDRSTAPPSDCTQ
jgi:hypothetical protein